MKKFAIAFVTLWAFLPTAFSQNVWTPEMQTTKVKAIGAPRVSPDTKWVVYTTSEAVLAVLLRPPHGPNEPKMQIAAMQSNLDWFEKYLK